MQAGSDGRSKRIEALAKTAPSQSRWEQLTCRLDCVLEPTKQQVLTSAEQLEGKVDNLEPMLRPTSTNAGLTTTRPGSAGRSPSPATGVLAALGAMVGLPEDRRQVVDMARVKRIVDEAERPLAAARQALG